MNIQKTIRVNSREEEEEKGCMVEGYRGKTEEETEEAKDRGTYQMKYGPLLWTMLSIMALQWLKAAAKYWEIDHILNTVIQTFQNSLFQSIPHIQ